MIESATHLMVEAGATWVLCVLVGLSVLCVAVAMERAVVFRTLRAQVAGQVPALRRALREGGVAEAQALIRAGGSVADTVVAAGLADADLGPEASEEAMAATLGLEKARLERHLLFLGTVGNNAPFVGLLGTVIGIVGAFDALGQEGDALNTLAPERVMGSIAEALVATAVGLIVAIPAVALFNYFQAQAAAALDDARTLGHVLLCHLRGQRERAE